MLYHLYELKAFFSPLNVFQYLTFRSACSFLTALAISLWLSPWFIRLLKGRGAAQSIRSDGPQTHHAKTGTPTMGGLLIYFTTLVSSLLWANLANRFVVLFLITATGLCLIGFLDDYQKSIHSKKKGISATAKIFLQLILALFVAGYLYRHPPNAAFATSTTVPYSKEWLLHLGLFYIPFMMMILVGSSNAVNLADGLDGLAGGTIISCAMTYGVFAYLCGHLKFSQYLRLIPVNGAGELTVLLAAMVGACMGFLWYNAYPAEIFMGDTGSLFMGGCIGLVAICVKQELLLLIAGGIFVAEALSVMAQVYSFRIHKKRIFKMAPLHHHFELLGWPEPKVTIRFWIISIVLALIALASLKLR